MRKCENIFVRTKYTLKLKKKNYILSLAFYTNCVNIFLYHQVIKKVNTTHKI